MAADLDPDKIQDPLTWQSMMSTLLTFMDNGIRTYLREGKDWAIDAISGDGMTVYQAKHHKQPLIRQSIADAKDELRKIKEYRKEKEYWKNVSHWVLFTNIRKGIESESKWEDEIVPLYLEIGIQAILWSWEKISALLYEHPAVIGPYFRGEPRVFKNILDELLRQQSENWFPPALNAPFVGRDEALEKFDEFMNSEKKIWAVSGAGGMGKTRFLLECAKRVEKERIAYWCTTDSLNHPFLFEGIVPERPVLLLIEELGSVAKLRLLSQEVIEGRMKSWKVIFTERVADAKTILTLKEAQFDIIRQEHYTLPRLNNPQTVALIKALLEEATSAYQIRFNYDIDVIVSRLGKICWGIPLWIGLTVKLLSENRNLDNMPEQAHLLLKKYLDLFFESLTNTDIPQENARKLLYWLALLSDLLVDAEETYDFLCRECLLSRRQIRDACQYLIDKGIAFRYGANGRFLKIAPDSIRDEILKEALDDCGKPSEFARNVVRLLLSEGIFSKKGIICKLAAIEFIQQSQTDEKLDLLGPIVSVFNEMTLSGNTKAQFAAIELIDEFSFVRPKEAVEILRNCWNTDLSEESGIQKPSGRPAVNHTRVRNYIPWSLFRISQYADKKDVKENVYNFYIDIIEEEINSGESFSSNSETTQSLFIRTLFGEYWSENYTDLVIEKAEQLLLKVGNDSPLSPIEEVVFVLLMGKLTKTEKMFFGPSADNSMRISKVNILPIHTKEWSTILFYLTRLKKVLGKESISESLRIKIAKIYVDVIPSLNRCVRPEKENDDTPLIKAVNSFILEQFYWIRQFLIENGSILSLEMRNMLRRAWDWHYKYSKQSELKAAAADCENVFFINGEHQFFDELLNDRFLSIEELNDRFIHAHNQRIKEKSNQEIIDFLKYASIYDPEFTRAHKISALGRLLGEEILDENQVIDLCKILLQEPVRSYQWHFSTSFLKAYLKRIRERDPGKAVVILHSCIENAVDPTILILDYYSSPWGNTGILVKDDLDLVIAYLPIFKDSSKKYQLLSVLTFYFWNELTSLIDTLWEDMANDERKRYINTIIENAPFVKRGDETNRFEWKTEYIHWFVDHISLLEDIDWLRNEKYIFEHFLPVKDCKSVNWLLQIIKKRMVLYSDSEALPHHWRLTYFIKADWNNRKDIDAFDALVEISTEGGVVGYFMPSYLRDLDTQSEVLGSMVAKKIESTKEDATRLHRLAWIAGEFNRNEKAWDEISAAVCLAVKEFSREERFSFYCDLDWHGLGTVTYGIGNVSEIYYRHLSDAQIGLEKDHNIIRREYWEKEAEWAKQRLQRAEEDAKEERGD